MKYKRSNEIVDIISNIKLDMPDLIKESGFSDYTKLDKNIRITMNMSIDNIGAIEYNDMAEKIESNLPNRMQYEIISNLFTMLSKVDKKYINLINKDNSDLLCPQSEDIINEARILEQVIINSRYKNIVCDDRVAITLMDSQHFEPTRNSSSDSFMKIGKILNKDIWSYRSTEFIGSIYSFDTLPIVYEMVDPFCKKNMKSFGLSYELFCNTDNVEHFRLVYIDKGSDYREYLTQVRNDKLNNLLGSE